MKQVIVQQGKISVEDVPVPRTEPGTILVRVDHSCISVGTEMSGISESALPLWKRALKNPEKVLKAAEMVAKQGFRQTRAAVQGQLNAMQPTGYSAAGTVVEVGAGIDDLQPGDRVACAGAQCAHHAEFIRPPRNLVVRVPDTMELDKASTVTLGAIALQGVRRGKPTLGETFVVIGLGLLGQLTVQMLRANGCRVIGMDLDPSRVELAKELGMDLTIRPNVDDAARQVARLTDGLGADGVIITAAGKSHEILATAFQMCRKKGRVVVVGDVGLQIDRADIYAKELDFFISTSYGPGRYDRRYEEQGQDYPAAYVRWTENRNMAEYLRLVDSGDVQLDPLIHSTFPVEQAETAYRSLSDGSDHRPLMILLKYRPDADASLTRIENPLSRTPVPGRIRLAIAGAGAFAQGTHLPNLQKLPKQYSIEAIVSRTAHNASSVARQFQARYSTTEFADVLDDPRVDAVLVSTRHDQHAQMVCDALAVGKHVLVEKPLAISQSGLNDVIRTIDAMTESRCPVLMTGFNRRFSPHMQRIAELVRERSNPLVINYRMNAGYLPLDLWYHGPEGGGRNIGEACHIYDLFVFLTNSQAAGITAQSIRPATGFYSPSDNFVATIGFKDGSVATLTYTAMGSSEFPKETMDVFFDGKVLSLNDYCRTEIHGTQSKGHETRATEKGHLEELRAFASAVQHGEQDPIPIWQQIEATRISFEVEQSLKTRHSQDADDEAVYSMKFAS